MTHCQDRVGTVFYDEIALKRLGIKFVKPRSVDVPADDVTTVDMLGSKETRAKRWVNVPASKVHQHLLSHQFPA